MIPQRWKECPKFGSILDCKEHGRFIVFKTPLDSKYNTKLNENDYFTPNDVINIQDDSNKIGLWIDLTNTTRYFDKKIIEDNKIEYLKFPLAGAEQATPSKKKINKLINYCKNFISNKEDNLLPLIAVHCTHGFNRTGLFICSYLIEVMNLSVKDSLNKFKECRPPTGIYRENFIDELYRRYETIKKNPTLNSNTLKESKLLLNKKSKLEFKNIKGIKLIKNRNKINYLRQKIKQLCHFKDNEFPGTKPTMINHTNIHFLSQVPYLVSWSLDGLRSLLYIENRNEIFLLSENNKFYQIINNCPYFPRKDQLNQHIKNTLLDGELRNDTNNLRYLIYDMITFENEDIGNTNFKNRSSCIIEEIIKARIEANKIGLINQLELFNIKKKNFWNIFKTRNMIDNINCLIFQPINQIYTPGRCSKLIEWRPNDEAMKKLTFPLTKQMLINSIEVFNNNLEND